MLDTYIHTYMVLNAFAPPRQQCHADARRPAPPHIRNKTKQTQFAPQHPNTYIHTYRAETHDIGLSWKLGGLHAAEPTGASVRQGAQEARSSPVDLPVSRVRSLSVFGDAIMNLWLTLTVGMYVCTPYAFGVRAPRTR